MEKRQAAHVEDSYAKRGVPTDEAERRAWATVNSVHGGEKPGGGGYGKPEIREPEARGGQISQAHRTFEQAGKKAAETRHARGQ